MEPKISTLEIRGFRALRDLTIEGLGAVNLITGRNNSGKSSVLEAIRILASGASPRVIDSILQFREENTDEVPNSYINSIPPEHANFRPIDRPKAVIHTWLAWQEDPGKPFGTAITKRFLDPSMPEVGTIVAWLRQLFFPSL